MKKDIAAIALDLDGTLLRHEGHIAPLTREVITELAAKGLKIIVATGRNADLVKDVDLPQEVCLVICANGSICYTYPDWQELERSHIEQNLARAIIERFRACHYHLHSYFADGRLVYEYMNDELGKRYAGSLLRIEKTKVNYDELKPDGFVKFISYGEPSDLEPIVGPLRQRFGDQLYANYSLPGVMELMSSSVSKLHSLKRLLPRLGLGLDQVLAIGDGFNDLQMLEQVAVGVVMGNAHASIVQQAHERRFYLAGENAEDGAAHFLRSWFKIL